MVRSLGDRAGHHRVERAKLDPDDPVNGFESDTLLYQWLSHKWLLGFCTVGVEELDQSKLTPLLRLKYHNSIADAVADLGRPEEIGQLFTGFQKYLYQTAP